MGKGAGGGAGVSMDLDVPEGLKQVMKEMGILGPGAMSKFEHVNLDVDTKGDIEVDMKKVGEVVVVIGGKAEIEETKEGEEEEGYIAGYLELGAKNGFVLNIMESEVEKAEEAAEIYVDLRPCIENFAERKVIGAILPKIGSTLQNVMSYPEHPGSEGGDEEHADYIKAYKKYLEYSMGAAGTAFLNTKNTYSTLEEIESMLSSVEEDIIGALFGDKIGGTCPMGAQVIEYHSGDKIIKRFQGLFTTFLRRVSAIAATALSGKEEGVRGGEPSLIAFGSLRAFAHENNGVVYTDKIYVKPKEYLEVLE